MSVWDGNDARFLSLVLHMPLSCGVTELCLTCHSCGDAEEKHVLKPHLAVAGRVS
jgi:hypothetical protein